MGRLKQEADLKGHALALLEERVRGSESAQLADRVTSLTSQVEEATQAAQAAREQKAAMVAAAKVRLIACCRHCQVKNPWLEGPI